jgi:DNA polymerase
MHVHDEIVIEADKTLSMDTICAQMSQAPPWANGLLLRADGFLCPFYRKD